ncbi:MAG TPA: UDP-N-acetylglucosamine 2-epimerase (non-hydrolyzing) [bacterium]|nr:UDP-N-acetylglucosamine 2-epimerase (non-hydrolyzing) [bacterium]
MKVLVSIGTRPEFIKMVPVLRELKKRGVENHFLYTGQHRDLCRPLFDFFAIHPDTDLDIMKENQPIAHITSSILTRLGTVLDTVEPDIVIVHGDTSTTLASSLAAFYKKIPVAHVEAGLRSHDRYSPFPEEMNRVLTDRLASHHFAPTTLNRDNLLREGIDPATIFVTGNTVIDTVKLVAAKIKAEKKKQVLITAHRRENFGEPMEHICRAIAELARLFPDRAFLYPVHPNPNVRKTTDALLTGISNVRLVEPLDYIAFITEMASSELVLTDSGGIQEEAPAFGIPVVVMRRETERTEGVEAGTLILAGTAQSDIIAAAKRLLTDSAYYASFANATNPYGDGHAAERIVQKLFEISF